MTPAPLQLGSSGGVELLVLLVAFGVAAVLAARWIYTDASARGSDWAWQWAVGIPLLFVIGVVPGVVGTLAYYLLRGERDERDESTG